MIYIRGINIFVSMEPPMLDITDGVARVFKYRGGANIFNTTVHTFNKINNVF